MRKAVISTLLEISHATADNVWRSKSDASRMIRCCWLKVCRALFFRRKSVTIRFPSSALVRSPRGNSSWCFSMYLTKIRSTRSSRSWMRARLAAYRIAWNSKGSFRFFISETSRFISIRTIEPVSLKRTAIRGSSRKMGIVLGIKNNRDALSRLDVDEQADFGITDTSLNGTRQRRTVSIISESGLYSLILRSRKPAANRFKRWMLFESAQSYPVGLTGQVHRTRLTPMRDVYRLIMRSKLQRAVEALVGDL